MLVRDQSLSKKEYMGRPTEALDNQCPCRKCWSPHDWKTPTKVFNEKGVHISNIYNPDMRCRTRELFGCPSPLPEPIHTNGKVCKRCKKADVLR